MSEISTDSGHAHDSTNGISTGWLFSTKHKDIGTMYLLFAIVNLTIGGVMALVIRGELFEPGLQIIRPEFFNQLVTDDDRLVSLRRGVP